MLQVQKFSNAFAFVVFAMMVLRDVLNVSLGGMAVHSFRCEPSTVIRRKKAQETTCKALHAQRKKEIAETNSLTKGFKERIFENGD